MKGLSPMEILPVHAEIDLGAIAHNIREVRRVTGPMARIMAVVKANAYGHGAEQVARVCLQNGSEYLGVARAHEGIALRKAGIHAPVLVFGYSPVEFARTLVDHALTQTIYSLEMAESFSNALCAMGKTLKVHIKVDTGMGRLGLVFTPSVARSAGLREPNREAIQEALAIAKLPGLEMEGIYTHFASADSADKEVAREQFDRFVAFADTLRNKGVNIPIRHAANSAAIIDMPETHLEMVRPGIVLYGLYPSTEVDQARISLRPAMQLKARVAQVKDVLAGFSVGYGGTYRTTGPTRIATIPLGYADGYSRLFSSRGVTLVKGMRAPVIGRVCMDMTMLDVGHIPGVSAGDEVVVFGEQQGASLPVDVIASMIDTINYEVVSGIGARVPRMYIENVPG